ncbi:hypothetical protein J4G48_0012845 [Bradyrhizobium barranii subsp. apii]|uniref:hypothetical protein n=1 Tax=Bradyrhizobium barranii TaxID=2992140 RepID=UPI001AA181E5|nr:hypothetical protein [Bradyrhizobium barranii]UPT98877.1 hypothetical protein J4G48_0012845 [Bradyrhizobium barranii subsp. apii]
MVILMPTLSGYGSVQHVPVSLPRVAPLLDGVEYLEPDDVPQPEIRDLRRLRRDKAEPARVGAMGLEVRQRRAARPSYSTAL